MSRETNPKLVGGFLLGAVALIVVVIVVFGTGRLFQTMNEFVVYFHREAKGLRIGSPVMVIGVEIGSVTSIRPMYDEKGGLVVETIVRTRPGMITDMENIYRGLPLDEAIRRMIDKGLRAQLNSLSLITGMLYIKVDYFPDTPVRLTGYRPDLIEIPSVPSSGEMLQQTLDQTLEKISRMPLVEVTEELHATLKEVQASLRTVNETMDSVKSLEIQRTLTHLDAGLEAAADLMNGINESVDPLSRSLIQTSDAARKALESLDTAIAGLEGATDDEQYEFNRLLQELSKSNRSIRVLLDYLQRDPQSLVFGKEKRR
jgi:paraquat-inducible protein B